MPAAAREITPDDLAQLPAADVTVLGEVHDNPLHHAHQAYAVAAMRPRALVFEMLTPDQAARVTPQNRGDMAALGAALGWADSGWPDFSLYHPIFTAAPSAQVFGGDLPRQAVRDAMTQGAAAVFGPDAARYGLAAPLAAADQAAREAEQDEAHCNALPADLLAGMVQAQRLRDAALARAVVLAMAETGGPVAVITGTGHARRDQGVPAALALAAPNLSVLSIGQTEADPGPDAPFDLWLVTPPVDRGDPCAAFGIQRS
nr:ChaN family lipoprotein [Fertoeibacter niger]